FFDQFFSTYTQKKAGGRIPLSLLVDTQGQACLYRVQPNSNVRPDYRELKRLLDATSWQPALLNGQPVKSTKVLYILFDGKRVNVQELE
ncbi:MAG TPA: hypothetical protein PKE63_11335, partial [Lacibacter sp.]|nr:hypothetical protein [Lacibacter sp.]